MLPNFRWFRDCLNINIISCLVLSLLKKKSWKWNKFILKRRQFNFIRVLAHIYIHASAFLEYNSGGVFYLFQKMLSIFSPKRQMYFYFHNVDLTFNNLFSTGVFFKKQLRCFKFFKKSITNINPLLLLFKYKFAMSLDFLYYLKVRNFSKKHHTFLRKFFMYIRSQVRFLLLTKSWNFTTKPKKRAKKKTYKQISKII